MLKSQAGTRRISIFRILQMKDRRLRPIRRGRKRIKAWVRTTSVPLTNRTDAPQPSTSSNVAQLLLVTTTWSSLNHYGLSLPIQPCYAYLITKPMRQHPFDASKGHLELIEQMPNQHLRIEFRLPPRPCKLSTISNRQKLFQGEEVLSVVSVNVMVMCNSSVRHGSVAGMRSHWG